MKQMTELVRNHSLEFVARQVVQRSLCYRNHAGLGGEPGGKRVDRMLAAHDIDIRHGHPRGDRHLLDNVEQAFLFPGGFPRQNLCAAVIPGNAVAVETLQLRDLKQRSPADHQCDRRQVDENVERVFGNGTDRLDRNFAGARIALLRFQNQRGHGRHEKMNRQKCQEQPEKIVDDQPDGFPLRLLLILEKIHYPLEKRMA